MGTSPILVFDVAPSACYPWHVQTRAATFIPCIGTARVFTVPHMLVHLSYVTPIA